MAMELYIILFLLHFHTLEAVDIISKPGCQSKCGDVSIPYPFGIGPHCSLGDWSNVSCNTTSNPPKLFINTTTMYPYPYEVVEFLPSEIRVKTLVTSTCTWDAEDYVVDPPYMLSSKNKITVIGCGADVATEVDGTFPGPTCPSLCKSPELVIDEESCTGGNGCFQTGIPNRIDGYFYIYIRNASDVFQISYVNETFNPCKSAFLVDPDTYTFKRSYLSNVSAIEEENTYLLNYNVGNKTCKDAKLDDANFACKDNSYCYEPNPGFPGYLCNCSEGYKGSPYLTSGCQEDVVNIIVEGGAVPALVKHLQAPPVLSGDSDFKPFEHEVEKGSAFSLGLLAVKTIFDFRSLALLAVGGSLAGSLLCFLNENRCIVLNWPMATIIAAVRSVTDFIYLLHMLLQFRLAYVAPESRVVGAGELVDQSKKIALHYFYGKFGFDVFLS